MSKNVIRKEILLFKPYIEAIVELFHPFVEAAVHDLESGKIVMLFHNISRREIGDATPLKELNIEVESFPDYFPPYYKNNWDGRELKCTSLTIRDDNGKPIGLICFNFDVSFFQNVQDQLGIFLAVKKEAENPVEMFGTDWQNKIEEIIQEYLQINKLSLEHLKRDEKKDLVQYLYQKGVFNYKNAAPLVAAKLKICRASIYNYLK